MADIYSEPDDIKELKLEIIFLYLIISFNRRIEMENFNRDELCVLKLSPYNQISYGNIFLKASVGVNGGYGENVITDGYHEAVETLYQSIQTNNDSVLVKIRESLSDRYLKEKDLDNIKIFSSFKVKNDDLELKKLVEEIIKEKYEFVLEKIVNTIKLEFGFFNAADSAVYPIIFCARHSIELCLKWLLRHICQIKIVKENKSVFIKFRNATNEEDKKKYGTQIENIIKCLETKVKTHNVEKLCDLICKYYTIDTSIKKGFDIILPHLCDYFIDPAGDVFRYFNDTEGTPNLESKGIELISLETFKKKYDIIYNKLTELCWLVARVETAIKETDTFTKTLSRWQIEEIAKKLPPKSTWADDLPAKKQQIMEEYGLSSREFGEALDIIKNHREFCVYIGMEIQFKTFSDSSIENYIKYVNGILDESEICKLLLPNDYILLLTFYDMAGRVGDGNGFSYLSERLDSVYDDYKSRLLEPYSPNFLALKNNYCNIIKGMTKCGQQTYIKKLEKTRALLQ